MMQRRLPSVKQMRASGMSEEEIAELVDMKDEAVDKSNEREKEL